MKKNLKPSEKPTFQKTEKNKKTFWILPISHLDPQHTGLTTRLMQRSNDPAQSIQWSDGQNHFRYCINLIYTIFDTIETNRRPQPTLPSNMDWKIHDSNLDMIWTIKLLIKYSLQD